MNFINKMVQNFATSPFIIVAEAKKTAIEQAISIIRVNITMIIRVIMVINKIVKEVLNCIIMEDILPMLIIVVL